MGYQHKGGRQLETAAIKNVLDYYTIAAPHTGKPYSEALLFGIGGGIGISYFVFDYEAENFTSLFIGTRITTHESDAPHFVQTICDRIGLTTKLQHSTSESAAEKALCKSIAEGQPVMAWVDGALLPYYGTPSAYHPLIVYSINDDKVQIGDLYKQPLTITLSQLAAARQGGEVKRMRSMTLSREATPIRIEEAIQQGLHDCIHQMREGFGPANFASNVGLKALPKWADLLVNTKDKRGWPQMFPAGRKLYDALFDVYNQIEHRGSGGSAFRDLFADFLSEASVILNRSDFDVLIEQFRKSARQWGELADALLPNGIPEFSEAKQLANRKRKLFDQKGLDPAREITEINAQLAELRARMDTEFPLDAGEVHDLLHRLRDHVLNIQRTEANAIATLELYLRA